MTKRRWPEVKPILDRALDLAQTDRETFLIEACGKDHDLLREVRTFLKYERDDDALLEVPILDLIAGRPPEYRQGEQIGAYRLQGEIARGGMGVVYVAERVEGGFEQQVAVKVLKRGFDTGDFVRRFRTEQQILADLDHPNIARLLDGGATEDGLPYLVMEKVDGARLDHYRRDHQPDLKQVLGLFLKICDAVEAAHRHMVVHCDLKPSNILVTRDGEPKLLDFGIAKVLRQGGDGTQSMSLRLGTPRYVSPEQRDGKAITTVSDVFSLGGLLYLLLTGEAPPLVTQADEPPFLPSRSGKLSQVEVRQLRGDLDAVVLRARETDPSKRYGSASELAQDIRRYLDGLPVEARPYTMTYALGRFVVRRRTEVAVVLLLISIGLGLILGARSVWQQERAENMMIAYLEMLEVIDVLGDEPKAEAVGSAVAQLVAGERLLSLEDRATVYDRLGRQLYRLEQWDQAETLLYRALELRQELNSPLTAASLNNLALVRKAQGDSKEAADLYVEAYELFLKIPEKPASFYDLLHNMAGIQKDKAEAERLYLEALEGRKRIHGEDSLEVARTYQLLGRLYWRSSRFDEAAPLLQDSVHIRIARLGEDHPSVAHARNNLGALYLALGEVDQSVDLLRDALEGLESLGEGLSMTARTRSSLGVALLNRSRSTQELADIEEAYGLLVQAWEDHREDSGPDHPVSRIIQRNLADAQLARGQNEDAETSLRDLLADADESSEDWRLADIRNLLGAVLTAQGRLDEAGTYFEGTLDAIVSGRGADSFYARDAEARIREWQARRSSQP